MAIPFVLISVVRRRADLPFGSLACLFGAFIFGCGFTHFMDVVVTYHPMYRLAGLLKLITAIVSWATVLALIPVIPKVLRMKSPELLEAQIRKTEQISESLRLSEMKHKLIIDSVEDYAIFMMDPEGLITTWNQGAYKLTGYTADEIIGRHFSLIYTDDDNGSEHPNEELCKALRDGRFNDEGWRIRKDGTRFWVHTVITAMKNDLGELIGFSKVTRDLTMKHQAEQLLRQTNTELERRVEERTAELERVNNQLREQIAEREILMEILPVAVFVSNDPKCERITGNSKGRQLLRLPDATNLSKSAPEGNRPNYITMLDGKELRASELPMHKAAIESRSISDFELQILFEDGAEISTLASASPLFNNKGEVRGAISVMHDITEARKMQQELLSNLHHVANVNRRKDEFMAMLGHELRNPLAALSNATSLLEMGDEINAEIKASALAILRNQCEHITRLVDDIISVTRALNGRMELKLEPVLLSDVLERAVQMAEPLISAKRHNLTVTSCVTGTTVTADKIRLVQVVSNLLTNAAKYTNDGGQIQLECVRGQKEVTITVRDNGIGIESKDLPEIFDLCVRTKRAVAKENGLGVGLTMVRTIVELHQGTVIATSGGTDRGSEFQVKIPVKEELPNESATR
jgi:PAS domain S-box-containing protein